MRKSKNPFRNGRLHVLRRRCDSCIFRPGGFHMSPERRDQMVAAAIKNNSAIFCHETLDGAQAICHGFWQKYKTQPFQVAERLQMIEFQEP